MCTERSKKVIENILKLQYSENKQLKTRVEKFRHLVKSIALYLREAENRAGDLEAFHNIYLDALAIDQMDKDVLKNLGRYVCSSSDSSFSGLGDILSSLLDKNKTNPRASEPENHSPPKRAKTIEPTENTDLIRTQLNDLSVLKSVIDDSLKKFRDELKNPVNLPACISFLERKIVALTKKLVDKEEKLTVFEQDNFVMHEKISTIDTLRSILMPENKQTKDTTSAGLNRDEMLLHELENYEQMLNKEKENNRILLDKIEALNEEVGYLKLLKYRRDQNEQVSDVNDIQEASETKPELWEYGKWGEDILAAMENFANAVIARESKSTPHDIRDIQEELNLYKRVIRCSVCNENKKDSILVKCSHTFCKGCLKSNLRVRNRKCPTCKAAYDNNDIKVFYL